MFSHAILARYWEAGYKADDLLQIWRALPPNLKHVLWTGMDAMSYLMDLATGQLPPAVDTSMNQTPPLSCTMLPDESDNQMPMGTFIMGWDPVLGVRTYCSANRWLVRRAGVHVEEFLARVARCDIPLIETELEHLCSVVDDLIGGRQQVKIRYMRVTTNIANPEQCDEGTIISIIRRTNVVKRDETGMRILSTTVLSELVSEEEYDQALQVNPQQCRPFMAATGDVRCAAELKRAYQSDKQKEKISNMVKTTEGLARLNSLCKTFERVFSPIIQKARAAGWSKLC